MRLFFLFLFTFLLSCKTNGSEQRGTFNVIINNETSIDLVVRALREKLGIIKPTKGSLLSIKASGDEKIYKGNAKFSFDLNPGKRISLMINDAECTLMYINAGRGFFDLRKSAFEYFIKSNQPEYNIFVNSTKKDGTTLLSSWRFKEIDPYNPSVFPPEITLMVKIYNLGKQPRVLQTIELRNVIHLKDTIKTEEIKPISEEEFK
ncbi:MAG: hypothetical protein ACOYT8_04785 [Candidatus Dependentiae bacterium]